MAFAEAISESVRLHSSCPVCGSADLKRRWDVKGYKVAACPQCSLVFVRNILTREELDAYYASISDPAYADDNITCLTYYFKKLKGMLERHFPQPGRLLDVGCSRGYFLDVMEGWERHGSELVPEHAEAARQRHGDRVVTGAFEDYPLRENYFDVITVQDVFDHFPDPMGVVAKCNRMLRPGGLIVIKVHNISCLYAKLSGKSFYAVIPPAHLFYYNRDSLTHILTNSGFEVIDSKFVGHLLTLNTVFFRLSRDDEQSIFHHIGVALRRSPLRDVKIYKNLHDIITVMARKRTTAQDGSAVRPS